METGDVPPALRERLGEGATLGLVDLFERAGRTWKAEVLETAGDRFGRMLAEESARIRILIAEQGARLEARLEEQGVRFEAKLEAQGARFEQKLAEQGARLEARFAEQDGRLEARFGQQDGRLEAQESRLVARMADLRSEVLKWAFLFWVGQVAAIAALLAFMLRGVAR